MEEFRGAAYHAAMIFGNGRGRGQRRGGASDEDLGQVQGQAIGRGRGRGRGVGATSIEDLGRSQDRAIGRGRGRATGRPQSTVEISMPPESSSVSPSSTSPGASVSSEGYAWGSYGNLREENYRMIFHEIVMEDSEDDKMVHPPPGFLDPLKVTLPTLSDIIEPGDERYCAVYTMANTDTIYLIFSHYFSHAVDRYIEEMGRWYFEKVQEARLVRLNVRDEQLVPGAIVVVYHKALREWKRARILDSFFGRDGQMYKVLFVDLGDYADVYSLNIVYMHEMWRNKPVFAIRARLPGMGHVHDRKMLRRSTAVSERILDVVQNKMVLVKFIEQVEFQNEKTWNVSLLSVKDRSGSGCEENRGGGARFPQEFSDNRPIENQVIGKLMGHRFVA